MSKLFNKESYKDSLIDESLYRIGKIRKLIGSLNTATFNGTLSEFENTFAKLDALLERYDVQEILAETINFEADFDDGSMEIKYECIDYLILNGGNLNELIYTFNKLNIYEIELLLERGYPQNLALKSIFEILDEDPNHESILNEAKSQIKFLTDNNKELFNEINYELLPINLPEEFLHFLVQQGLNLKVIFSKMLFGNFENSLEALELQKNYIEAVLKYKPNLDTLFYEVNLFNLAKLNINIVKYLLEIGLSPDALIKTLVNCLTIENYLNYNLGLQKEFIKKLLELALDEQANLNYLKEGDTLAGQFAELGEYELLDLVLLKSAKDIIPISAYIEGCYSIKACVEMQKRFPDAYSEKEIYQYLRASGKSNSETGLFLDKYNLSKDYLNYQEGFESNLSEMEIALIESKNINLSELKNAYPTNKYGFTILHIALLNRDFALANKLLAFGMNLTEANKSEISGILMLPGAHDFRNTDEKELRKIFDLILSEYKDIDIILSNGENVIDHYLSSQIHKELVINKSKDPLFYFFKDDANLFLPSEQIDKTHIAISHGEHFWSTGVYAFARLVINKHPDVRFHLVTKDMIEAAGEKFIQQFDGWINPGAGDSFPTNPKEFNLTDWQPKYEIEETYQLVLNKTALYNIPYMGMCAGAQHFLLFNKGYLSPLDNYNGGQHEITYLKGTLAHFQTMTYSEQQQALISCEFPEIKFRGDTAHHFAGVKNKLGDNIELGAISEDGIPMSYAHNNGLSYATQFHPEHYYNINISENITNYQMVWLDNFINISKMHHSAVHNNGTYPKDYMKQVKFRLEECKKLVADFIENEPYEHPFSQENAEPSY